MRAHREGKPGDKPLLAAVVATLALAAMVIFGVHQAAMPTSGNPKVNPVKIQELIHEGKLSDHPAEHFEVMPSQ
jgi:hypothetical protein